jgi:hypothetical protein
MTARGVPHVTIVYMKDSVLHRLEALSRQLEADEVLTCHGRDGMHNFSTCRRENTDMRLVAPVPQSARGTALRARVQPQSEA